MKTTKQTTKSERVNAIQSLRDANKEVKSLSGAIKIVQKFWGSGYKTAFAYLGVTFKDLDFKIIKSMCQHDEEGEIFVKAKRQKKSIGGVKVFTPVLIKSGKNKGIFKDVPVMEEYNKIVTTWSVSTLFKVIEQTKGLK